MGLFKKKHCDICGKKVGMFSKRKLRDGTMCSTCEDLLSPWFDDRRYSTLEEIKKQLELREANKAKVESFHHNKVIYSKYHNLYIDEQRGEFAASYDLERAKNPDIIKLSAVTGCFMDVEEHSTEEYKTNEEGEREHYQSARYKYSYDYYVCIDLDHPYLDRMTLSMNNSRIDEHDSRRRRDAERDAQDMVRYMRQVMNSGIGRMTGGMGSTDTDSSVQDSQQEQKTVQKASQKAKKSWTCPGCGTANKGKFCTECGAKKPAAAPLYQCDKCGWEPEDPTKPPKFCPNCGDIFDENDVK